MEKNVSPPQGGIFFPPVQETAGEGQRGIGVLFLTVHRQRMVRRIHRQPGRHRREIPIGRIIPPGHRRAAAIAAFIRVYPRACGGTGRTPGPRSRHKGLSPRMRGNRSYLRAKELPQGSIPAHAGEPLERILLFCLYNVKERHKFIYTMSKSDTSVFPREQAAILLPAP